MEPFSALRAEKAFRGSLFRLRPKSLQGTLFRRLRLPKKRSRKKKKNLSGDSLASPMMGVTVRGISPSPEKPLWKKWKIRGVPKAHRSGVP